MMYKDKTTDDIKPKEDVLKELKTFLSNGSEFDEYKDKENKYISDYYIEVEQWIIQYTFLLILSPTHIP